MTFNPTNLHRSASFAQIFLYKYHMCTEYNVFNLFNLLKIKA